MFVSPLSLPNLKSIRPNKVGNRAVIKTEREVSASSPTLIAALVLALLNSLSIMVPLAEGRTDRDSQVLRLRRLYYYRTTPPAVTLWYRPLSSDWLPRPRSQTLPAAPPSVPLRPPRRLFLVFLVLGGLWGLRAAAVSHVG